MAAMPQQAHRLALIYQADALHQHLRQALSEFGASIVYECHANTFDHAALDASGAEVIVINLDPNGADEFDALTDLLLDETRRVIFNDGEVSSRLEGWDLARWTRHLAAKVVGATEVNPPRPQGSEAIPVKVKSVSNVRVEAANEAVTQHRHGNTGEFRLEGDEFAAAMSADTRSSMARDRAAFHTDDEAVRPELFQRAQGDTATYDVDAAELHMHLPPDAAPAPSLPPTLELSIDDLPIARAPDRSKEPPTLELMLDEPVAPVSKEPPTLELPLDDVVRDATAAATTSGNPTLELDAAALGLIARRDADADVSIDAAVSPDDHAIDLSIDESLLAAIDAPPAGLVHGVPAADTDTDTDAFAGLDADLLDLPDVRAGAFARLGDDAENEVAPDEFAETLRDFGFLDEAPAAPRGEEIMDLDTLLLRAGEAEAEKRKGSLGQPDVVFKPLPVTPAAARPQPPAEQKPAPAGSATAASPAPAPAAAAVKARSLADFEAALSGLSLEPTDDSPAPPATAAAKPPAAPTAPTFGSSLGGLSLEPIEGEVAAAPASGRAVFGVADAPAGKAAPAAPAAGPIASSSPDELALEGFDFDFDENTEIRTDSIVRLGSDAALDDMSVDMDSELDALLQREAGLVADLPDAAPSLPQLGRVFVLGASIGGPDAVREFVAALPAQVPALFLLAQHMGTDFLELMVQQLTKASKLKVRAVADGDVLAHGEIVVVPPTQRLQVDRNGRASLGPMPEPSAYSPSIDQVMRDVAETFGASSGAIIFSGMAHDAIEGAREIVARGGVVWVQDPSSCVISSMVDGAREAGVVSYTARPTELARHFLEQYPK